MKIARLGEGPEIFHTLQGEGPSVGSPAVFIRASRCNLHCVWCDTDHTWNFEGTPWPHLKDSVPGYTKHRKSESSIELTPAAAAALILNHQCLRVVITGGEPLLQQDGFLEMIHQIRSSEPTTVFEVETNATLIPSDAFAAAVNQFNVSPKLANSGVAEALRFRPDALSCFAAMPTAWFKFVVTSATDLGEIQALRTRYQIANERILLMPEGRSARELDRNAAQIASICRDLGFRFCDRLHVRLWGDQRGV
jgi:organic radical activating enzyme